jgi:hypothetical protein
MTWVLAPLLVGGASTLVAILVRAVARLNDGRPGEARLGGATPRGGPPWNHPCVKRT